MRLLRFALANVRRRPERFVLSTVGIALAVMAVVVVRTVAQGHSTAGATSLHDVLRGDPLWVVGASGAAYDPDLGALLPTAPAPQLQVPEGWSADRVVGGPWDSPAGPVALYGRDDVDPAAAQLGSAAAALLGVDDGERLSVAGSQVRAQVVGEGRSVTVATSVAAPVVGDDGWWTVAPSAADSQRRDLGAVLAAASGIPSTTDPTVVPADGATGLVYDTVGGSSLSTFEQGFSAMFSGRVTGSTLGLVSTVGLVLGFVIAVSSFLAAVQERRREFGIMSSIGLADEVLYFFLVESALVFLVAFLAGALAAGVAVALVVPTMTTTVGWLQAAGAVAAWLPAMAIVGALVPVHRLLQQRPVALLQDAP